MKYFFSVVIFYCLLSIDWDGIFSKRDKTRDFIPGTYLTVHRNQWTTFADTLVIRKMEGNIYIIREKTFLHFLNPGDHIPDANRSAGYTAFYDQRRKILMDNSASPLFSFDPDKAQLFKGSVEFAKIGE